METHDTPENNVSEGVRIWAARKREYTAVLVVTLVLVSVYLGSEVATRQRERAREANVANLKGAIERSLELQYQGDFGASAQNAEYALALLDATSSLEAQRTITVLANAHIWSAELDKHLEAVDLAKQQLRDLPGSPRSQAFIINRLIGYMTAAMEPEVIERVFTGEPFAELYDSASVTDSIFKNLAGESLSRHPTFLAYACVGIWHAEKLFKHYDGIETLSQEEMREAVSGVQDAIAKMNGIIDEELKVDIVYKQTRQAQFDYYQEFLHGALALTDPAYLTAMQEAYERVRSEVAAQKNTAGNTIALLDTRLVYADFAFSTYVNAVAGENRANDVQRSLQEMIDLMTAHPEAHEGGFLAFVRQTARSGPNGTEGHGRWYSYGRFKRMADFYPPFKDFLNANGWGL